MEPAEQRSQGANPEHPEPTSPSALDHSDAPQPDPAVSMDPLDRLERALSALIDRNEQLRHERDGLRQQLQRSTARVASLEGEILDANQRRSDVAKRIDELIAQIDQLDAQLAAAPALDGRAQP